MKKVLLVLLVVALVVVAGAAVAAKKNREREFWGEACGLETQGRRGGGDFRRGEGLRGNLRNAPDEVRDKVVELEKLRVDMRDALSRTPLDRAKVLEIHARMTEVRQGIATWLLNQRMDRMEQRQKERELNRNVPVGAPPASTDVTPVAKP